MRKRRVAARKFDPRATARRPRREYPVLPMVGVGGVIVHGRKVLLVRRARPPLQGEWSIPGGLVETGETLRQAVVREVREETGLSVSPKELLAVLDRITYQRAEPAPRGRGGRRRVLYHYVLVDFFCRLTKDSPHAVRAASDASQAGWFSPSALARMKLRPATRVVIRRALALAARARKGRAKEKRGTASAIPRFR